MKEKIKKHSQYLACERRWVFLLLVFVAGFFGAFTYLERGGVFCNAQSLNMVLTGVNIGRGDLSGAFYYIVPLLAYFSGVVVSELLPKPLRRLHIARWDTVFIVFEIGMVIVLSLIPDSVPYQISHIIVNFTIAMQYNTFRNAEGEIMTSTFCTLHMRQMGEALVRWLRGSKDKSWKGRTFAHLSMIVSFILGAGVFSVLSNFFGAKALLFTIIPLAFVLAYLLYSDLVCERDKLETKPQGH